MPHLIGHLSPVVHPKRWELIRLPVRRVEGQYVVYVADGMVRRYDEETLPDALRTKFAMILATPQPELIHENNLQKLHVYINNHNEELWDVGWRVSETYFCLIVDRETLESLKGGTQNGTNEGTNDGTK